MSVNLKDIDKAIKKVLKKIVIELTNTSLLNEIGNKITEDIKLKMSLGKMPDGKGGIKNAPALTKGTKRVYRSKGVREKPRFEFKNKLKPSIGPKVRGNTVTIESSTPDGRDKIKWLKKSNKRNGKPKKERIVMGWTKTRSKIIKKIISSALKNKFN